MSDSTKPSHPLHLGFHIGEHHAAAAAGDAASKGCHHKLHTEVVTTEAAQISAPGHRACPANEGTSLTVTPAHYGSVNDSRSIPIPDVYKYDGGGAGDRSGRSGDANGDLYKYSGPDAKLDPRKSVQENMQAGAIQSKDGGDRPQDHPPLEPGKAPKITVQYQDLDANAHQPKPDFIVHKDGTTTCVHNPEGADGKINNNIVIQVERERGDVDKPTAAQQKALDGLVDYEGKRVADQYGSALPDLALKDGTTVKQVDIDDAQRLVNDKTMRHFGDRIPDGQLAPNAEPVPDIQKEARRTSGQVGRTGGSDGGSSVVPQQQSDDTFNQQAPTGDTPTAAVTDTIGALQGDKTHPYETIHQMNDGTSSVGRYGFNHRNISHWMGGFMPPNIMALLGDPPDWSKLADILAKDPNLMKEFQDSMQQASQNGQVPADFAKQMQDPKNIAGFGNMVEHMDGKGGQPSAGELDKYLPKSTQDGIAQSMVNGYAKEMGMDPNNLKQGDAGKLALSMFLGHAPNEQEQGNPSYRDYMNAAENVNHVAQARQDGTGDVLLHGANGKVAAVAADLKGQSLWGWSGSGARLGCAASVSTVMEKSGFNYIRSASVSGVAEQAESHGWQKTQGLANAQPGDMVYGRIGGDAHIGIVGNNGKLYDNWSSDGRWHEENLSSSYIARHFGRNTYTLHQPA